jgi:hypothetical protein
MTERLSEASPRLKARIAGILYLITTVTGVFALNVRNGVMVRGDAAATAAKLLESQRQFRLGIAADLVAGVCYVGVAVILYDVLKPVSRTVSLLAAFLASAGCVIGAVLLVDVLAPLVLLGGAPSLAVFGPDQLQALALTSLRLNAQGSSIAFVFFGSYCLVLGYLIFRSGFFPRLLGVLVAVAGVGWLTSSFASLLAPEVAPRLLPYVMACGGLGEGSLCLWLIVVGVNVPRWEQRATREGWHVAAIH